MPESRTHKRLKNLLAGNTGKTEVVLPSGRRLDALSRSKIASEVERSGFQGIRKSVTSLKEALATQTARKVRLVVPHTDIDLAVREMRRQRVRGDVENLGGTDGQYVPKRTRAKR